ncbi:MAG: hypothetical protein V1821_01970, partial [bacterium]
MTSTPTALRHLMVLVAIVALPFGACQDNCGKKPKPTPENPVTRRINGPGRAGQAHEIVTNATRVRSPSIIGSATSSKSQLRQALGEEDGGLDAGAPSGGRNIQISLTGREDIQEMHFPLGPLVRHRQDDAGSTVIETANRAVIEQMINGSLSPIFTFEAADNERLFSTYGGQVEVDGETLYESRNLMLKALSAQDEAGSLLFVSNGSLEV